MSGSIINVETVGRMKRNTLFLGGLVFALAQLIIPMFFPLIDLQLRSIHIILGVSLALLSFPFRKSEKAKQKISLWDIFTVIVVLAANINIFLKAMSIYMRPGEASSLDLALGVALTLIILDASRRTVGWAIPIMVAFLFFYILQGHIFPGVWRLEGISLEFVLNSIYYSARGIYGSVTGMSATFIAMFIIFGALLAVGGGGRTFIDIALVLTGRLKGGPAKAAVVASALFGSISGSGVANVSITGNYTIPLMKRLGYHPDFAGGVEAIASTGGGITPPLMSITAFMMAEFLGISYLKIIGYAIIPCVLFYTGVLGGVHFQTVKKGLSSIPPEEIPKAKEVITIRRLCPLVIPTGVLLVLIALGKPLVYAGFYACTTSIAVTLLLNGPNEGWTTTLQNIFRSLSEGGLTLARIVPILVAVNILVNMIGITGIAPKLSGLIMELGSESLIFALLIAIIVPFILGTSMPVVPTYVLSLSILVPPLLRLGVDEVSAHLFLIYWSLLGGVTPPTCTQAIVAASIANGNWIRTGLIAVKLGIVAFIMPFFFVLNPALVARSDIISIITYSIPALLGAVALSYGFFGPVKGYLGRLTALLFLVSGVLLFFPNHILSLTGFVLGAGAFIVNKLRNKPKPMPA